MIGGGCCWSMIGGFRNNFSFPYNALNPALSVDGSGAVGLPRKRETGCFGEPTEKRCTLQSQNIVVQNPKT